MLSEVSQSQGYQCGTTPLHAAAARVVRYIEAKESVVARGGGELLVNGHRVSFGEGKSRRWMVVTFALLCECTQCHHIVYLEIGRGRVEGRFSLSCTEAPRACSSSRATCRWPVVSGEGTEPKNRGRDRCHSPELDDKSLSFQNLPFV